MRSFASLGALATHLAFKGAAMATVLHQGLDRVAAKIERTAKSEIGHYQPTRGPFPEWAPLAESTEDEKARLGFDAGAPLLRTGELRDSISHETHGLEAVIGSTDERMVFHEFGTSKMPARPVLGPAGFRNKRAIERIIGTALLTGFIGADQIHPSLGYDFTTEGE